MHFLTCPIPNENDLPIFNPQMSEQIAYEGTVV